jgi:hypothetical protein
MPSHRLKELKVLFCDSLSSVCDFGACIAAKLQLLFARLDLACVLLKVRQ